MTQAVEVTSSGTEAVASGAKLMGVQLVDGGTAGTVTIKDGGSTGTVRFPLSTAGTTTNEHVDVPGGGIVFESNVYVELTNVTAVTLFYEDA